MKFKALLVVVAVASMCAAGINHPAKDALAANNSTPVTLVSGISAPEADPTPSPVKTAGFDYTAIPAYTGEPSVAVNGNIPFFTDSERSTWVAGTEYYSPLDSLGRCGVTYATVGEEIMPKYGEVRGEIGMVKPSGWKTAKYPDVIEDVFLYNRCHLIGWQLGNENANTRNLITGTRYLNVEGMLPYENMVAEYVHRTKHHILYRVTPYFEGKELVARGVLIEAESVEDKNIRFCVWCYNVQPCIEIDYATGKSTQVSTAPATTPAPTAATCVIRTTDQTTAQDKVSTTYVLNTNTHKCHLPSCSSVSEMAEHNKKEFTGSVEEVKEMGYTACGRCHPF